MAQRARVFLASSSEGLEVTTAVRRLLLGELGDTAEIEPWTRAFELSATYIESLERNARESDFAVLVLTPDDVTTSRKKQTFSPRDNVVFELGLFLGALGRERCFVVQDDRPGLKVPSDLLGVNAAKFRRPADGDLKAALDPTCARIAERIVELGPRDKAAPLLAASRATVRGFVDRLKGAWWERFFRDGHCFLSFVQIELDELHNSVRLVGKSHDADGAFLAEWKSVVARVSIDERKILYHWQGWYPSSAKANPQDRFHGFGEIELEAPRAAGAPFVRGGGRFWDVDETHPEKTLVNSFQLRRVEDGKVVATMIDGKDKEREAVVVKTLRDW